MTVHRFLVCLLAAPMVGLLAAPGPQSAPAPGESKVLTNSIGMKLALIPAGKFQMGSPASQEERESDELQHDVTITRPFYLGVHEVTQEQYQKVTGKNPAFFTRARGGGPQHPVEQVPWREAADFCKKLSMLDAESQAGRIYRLPTEAEWEYACRAGTATVFHCGDALSSQQANCNGSHPYGPAAMGPFLQRTQKAGSYQPNAWGLYDMHGNVWEWCADWYDPDYYKSSPKQDPKGPAKGVLPTGFGDNHFVVVRGGCWLDEARGCRSAYRFRFMPTDQYRLVGFRVVCETTTKEKEP